MVLRFFCFIWGAIFLTLVLIVMLIAVFKLAAPDSASRAIEKDLLLRQFAYTAETDSPEAALKIWQEIAPAHPDFRMAIRPGCATGSGMEIHSDGCQVIQYIGPTASFLDRIKPLFPPLLLGGVVSALAAILLSQWLTRPIRTVSRGLKTLAGGDFGARIQPELRTTVPDLVELGAAFDHAATRLQELAEGRRRLFHDISHEIRSPLARLRAAVGILEVNPHRYTSMLEQMETDIGRLDHLVDEILTLARFEKSLNVSQAERLDILDLLEPIMADANFEGQQRSIAVLYEGVDQMQLYADAELLHRAFENLIRNALNYAPDGSRVLISGHVSDASLVLEIADEGPGVAQADLKRIFIPFERAGSTGRIKGVGLGLAIAARAVEAHGGAIVAQNRTQGGLLVRVTLPVAFPSLDAR